MNGIGTPSALILARAAASRSGDFGFIFDSYHADSNFRRQFPLRQDYLDFAHEVLDGEIVLRECRVLHERFDGEEAAVLFYQRVEAHGVMSETLELAWLKRGEQGWSFDCSERLDRSAIERPLEEIEWDDFARAAEKVVF